MKSLVTVILFSMALPSFSNPDTNDTTIRGVRIGFSYSNTIFPTSWQGSPISAYGQPIAETEIGRSKAIMIKALGKYPVTALSKDLKAVYFLKSMKFYDVGYGGTNSNDALYLTNNGSAQGYTDLYLEQTFHHEYSSILYRNHSTWFNEAGWTNANITGFDYNDPENGVGAIRNNESSQDLDTALCRKGFLTQYSLSGLENDINTFAQNIFSPSPGFWQLADQYPRINRKIKLLVEFYHRIDPLFTEDYFRKLNP
ncbi:MAG TPA: hypothetical protein VGO58_03500 [Chitinophagaceae bacterium]|jgi:hypothetical protein|nr:hypothetical protein [Chitinophagaceae bacterium]